MKFSSCIANETAELSIYCACFLYVCVQSKMCRNYDHDRKDKKGEHSRQNSQIQVKCQITYRIRIEFVVGRKGCQFVESEKKRHKGNTDGYNANH